MSKNNINYKGNVILKNSTFSLIYKVISMCLSMVSAPLLLDVLGTDKYGVFTSVLSVVSWMYYFDLGIGNGLRFNLTKYLADNDEEGAEKTVTIAYVLVSIIMFILIIISILILSVFNVGNFFGIARTNENLNLILIVSLILAGLNFIFSLVNNILLATQESSKVNFFSLFGQLFYIFGLFIYKTYGFSLILLVAFAEGFSQFLKNIIETFYVYKKYPYLRPKKNKIDISYSKGIMSFGLKMFALQMSALVLNSTDNLLILKYFGSNAVTPYSFVYKYFGLINTVFSIAINPIMSAYTMAYERKDYSWIKSTFKRFMYLYFIIAIGTVIAAFIFIPFSKIWLQRDLHFDAKLIALTCLYYLMLMFSHNFSTFVNGIGVVNETTIAVILQALLNIPCSIYFATSCGMGVNGVIMGSIVCMCISNVIYPYITIREFKNMKNKGKIE